MLPISVDLSQLRVVLVGDGAAARRRLALLDEAGASSLEFMPPRPEPALALSAGARLQRRLPLPAEIARAQLVFVAGVRRSGRVRNPRGSAGRRSPDQCRGRPSAQRFSLGSGFSARRSDRGDLDQRQEPRSGGTDAAHAGASDRAELGIRLDRDRGTTPGLARGRRRPGGDRPMDPGMGSTGTAGLTRRLPTLPIRRPPDTLTGRRIVAGGSGMTVIAIIAQGMMGSGSAGVFTKAARKSAPCCRVAAHRAPSARAARAWRQPPTSARCSPAPISFCRSCHRAKRWR